MCDSQEAWDAVGNSLLHGLMAVSILNDCHGYC